MANYPALRASSTTWRPGSDRTTNERGIRFRHCPTLSGGTLELGYQHLSASEMALIRSHVSGQRGAGLAFELSSEAWANHGALSDVWLSATFRHSGAVAEDQQSAGLVSPRVTLTNVLEPEP